MSKNTLLIIGGIVLFVWFTGGLSFGASSS